MKVGILTFLFGRNYGAFLQAHGLRQSIEALGHSATFVNYVPSSCRVKKLQGWGFRSGKRMPAMVKQRIRYEMFRLKNLPWTQPCNDNAELSKLENDFDAFVVGSDQVWNGHVNVFFEGAYFLYFVNRPECRKISYAACFGNSRQPKYTLEEARPLLERFDHLSVRNQMSANIVDKLSKKKAELVLDPTLIYDYRDIDLRKKIKGRYIFAYLLPHEKLDKERQFLTKVRDIMQIPVISLCHQLNVEPGETLIASAGPVEWLRLLKNAELVCTNSFHGTVFSVKFHKPFLSWGSDTDSGFRGPERVLDFLATCGIEDRLVFKDDSNLIRRLIEDPIDYGMVSTRLEPQIKRSRRFLQNALS